MVEKINHDLKEAMKNQDKFAVSVLRMLKSALQLESISLKKELSDNEVLTVIKRNVKQRKDSMAEYEKYGKTEEVENLAKEVELLQNYLGEEMSEEAINVVIDEVFEGEQPTSMKDMGKIMKILTEKLGPTADMSLVSKLVKDRLMK